MNEIESLVSISLRIKNTRKAVGISQKKLANIAGLSQSTIARLESDILSLNPSYETVYRVLDSLHNFQSSEKESGMADKPIKSVMHKMVIYVSPKDPVVKAVGIMKENNFTQLPVLDVNKAVIGTINEKRLLKIATESPKKISNLTVSEILDPALPAFDENTEIYRIRPVLENFGAVLAMRGSKATGIVTIYDLLKFL